MQADRYHQHNHQQVTQGFQEEVPIESQGGDDQPADGRGDDAGRGKDHTVEGQGAGEGFAGDGVGNDGVADRLNDAVRDSRNDHVEKGVPPAQRTGRFLCIQVCGYHQERKRCCGGGHAQLGNHDQLAAVDAVSQHSGPGPD